MRLTLARSIGITMQLKAVGLLVEYAGVAQLVEYKLPKLGVAGPSPVARSILWSI